MISRLKANKNSQASKPAPKKEEEIVEDIADNDLDEEMDEDIEEAKETPKPQEKVVVKPQKQELEATDQAQMNENAQRILLLQDNGIFRAELLHQMQELNKAMVVIAGILVDGKK